MEKPVTQSMETMRDVWRFNISYYREGIPSLNPPLPGNPESLWGPFWSLWKTVFLLKDIGPFLPSFSLWEDYNFCPIGVSLGTVTCFGQWYMCESDMWHLWAETLRAIVGSASPLSPLPWDWHVPGRGISFRLCSQTRKAWSRAADNM